MRENCLPGKCKVHGEQFSSLFFLELFDHGTVWDSKLEYVDAWKENFNK